MIDLGKLIQESIAKVKAMTPEQRAEMFRQQRRSFVRGQIGFGTDKDEAEYRKALQEGDKEKIAQLDQEAQKRIKRAEPWM